MNENIVQSAEEEEWIGGWGRGVVQGRHSSSGTGCEEWQIGALSISVQAASQYGAKNLFWGVVLDEVQRLWVGWEKKITGGRKEGEKNKYTDEAVQQWESKQVD